MENRSASQRCIKINYRQLIIPLILEQLLAVSVGMVDTIMVSTVGEVAVSGVALVDNINRLIIQVLSAFAAGGVVICSQYYGRGDHNKARKSSAQLECIMVISSLLFGITCLLFSSQILGLFFGNANEDVLSSADTYMRLTAISYPFLGIYNAQTAVFRSFGNSKISMKVSLIMNLLNIGLNAVFVLVLQYGVLGVGIATLISRGIAGILMKGIGSTKRNVLRDTSLSDYIPDIDYIKRILHIAIPNGAENGMFQLGKIMVVTMIAGLGTSAIAANSIAYQIIDFPNVPGVAIGLALVTVIGQDIGAGDKRQAVLDTRRLVKYAYVGDWTCKILLFIFAPVIVSIFSLSVEATEMCILVLRCFSVASLPVWPLSFTLPNALRGAGDVFYTMVVGIISMWLCRIAVSYILVNYVGIGVLGVWIGMFADWYVRGGLFLWRYASNKWMEMRVIE